MRITGRELRKVIRETLALEMRRVPYGGEQPDFDPNEVDDDDFEFLGGPPELSPEEMAAAWDKPVRGGTFVINKDTGAYELSGMPDFPGRGAEAAFKLRQGRMTGRLRRDKPRNPAAMFGDIDPEELGLDEARGRLTGPPAQVLSVIGDVEPSVAYIDDSFYEELKGMGMDLQTGEDLARAVEQGLALVWASGMIGGAADPSLTVVPPDAKIRSYPYVFTRQDRITRETEAVVQVGMGPYESGPLIYSNHPRALARPEDLSRSVTRVMPIDLMGSIDVPETADDVALGIGLAHRAGRRGY